MTPQERSEAESRAERSLRRGELAEAVALYERLATAHPDDAALAARLAQVRENLQPMELQNPKARLTEPGNVVNKPLTPEQEGEKLFAQGDYVGAAAAYRRALKERPDSELVKERLVEIFQLAQAVNPGVRGASPTTRSPPLSVGSANVALEPEDILRSLLGRIAERRRSE